MAVGDIKPSMMRFRDRVGSNQVRLYLGLQTQLNILNHFIGSLERFDTNGASLSRVIEFFVVYSLVVTLGVFYYWVCLKS